MTLRPLDFESSASASSATSADDLVDRRGVSAKRRGGSATYFGGEPLSPNIFGPGEDRTRDLHNAIVAFSQLNYRPITVISKLSDILSPN